jgi:protein-S-isoprenylcysteine O-methyltransferase Ste14
LQLRDQLAATGERLFRGRSYLPLVLVPLFFASFVGTPHSVPYGAGREPLCLAVSLVGLLIRVYIVCTAPRGTSERSTRSIRAATINTSGAYSIVRHPLYIANYLIALGISLMSPAWLFPVIVTLLTIVYYERIAAAEERFLASTFGASFDEWAARVPAVIPRAFTGFVPLPFNWERVLGELHALMAIAAGFFVADVTEDSVARGRLSMDGDSLIVLLTAAIPFVVYATAKKLSRLAEKRNSETTEQCSENPKITN